MNTMEILEQEAIDAAMNFQWSEAIKINKKIFKNNKKNLPALLRMAFAYFQIEDFGRAKKYYQQVVKLHPMSSVAKENLERIQILQKQKIKKNKKTRIILDPDLFLETAGRTKSVKLVNLGQKTNLARLMIGEEVFLKTKKRKVEIRTRTNDYIGSLPDDLSKRLRLFLKAKSQYRAYIKETNLNNLIIFIQEEKKGKRVTNYASFPLNLSKNITQIGEEIDKDPSVDGEESFDDPSELDLEKIADSIAAEDKESLPYETDEENEED